MGFPMARNLCRAGLGVRAWNRSREKAEPLAADGVAVASTIREAAEGADVVVTMLSDAQAVFDVMDGDEGALHAMERGAAWAQMSTIGLAATERCTQLAAERQIGFVDAPLLGTKQPAEEGNLIVLASGPGDVLDRCEPIFDAVGRRTVHLGSAGRGSRLKLVLNTWVVSVVEALAEAIALAEALELGPGQFLETIEGGPLDAGYAQIKGKSMIEKRFPPAFSLKLALKDVELVRDAAASHGIELPVIDAVHARFMDAVELGHGDEDLAATYWASTQKTRR
jgi:3-hydroxyisobutyrate dehydrogenase